MEDSMVLNRAIQWNIKC